MKRLSHEQYIEKCSKAKQDALDRPTFDGLDEESYQKAVEGLDEDEEPEEGEEGEGEGEEEEGEGGGEAQEKSERELDLLPDEEELVKAMELLQEGTAGTPDQKGRRAELARKVAGGEPLTKSEVDELQAPLDAAPAEGGTSLRKSLEDEEQIQAAYDGSEFLHIFGDKVVTAVDALEKSLLTERTDNQQFRRRLATGLEAFGRAVVEGQQDLRKSVRRLEKALDRVAAAPIPWAGQTRLEPGQVPRSPREGAPLPALARAGELKKSQAMSALSGLMEKAETDGREDLCKSYGDVLARMECSHGDWRRTSGLTPEMAVEIVSEAGGR
jgi:hypothetical protein